MNIDHFGVAVRNISLALKEYELLGFYPIESLYTDKDRNIKIQFIENHQGYRLELIEVDNIQNQSPINSYIEKSAHSIYHICYHTNNIEQEIEELRKNGYIILSKPDEAIAFHNRRVAFLFHKSIGIIELVEII